MGNKKSTAERLAVIETELLHIKESIRQIHTNHLPHIYDTLDKMEKAVGEIKNNMKSKLTGRDKAVVYGAAITALGLVIVKILEII